MNMDELKEWLNQQADLAYRQRHIKIINTSLPLIGVRMPALREAARKICKSGKATEFLAYGSYRAYELLMIRGLVIAMEAKRHDFGWISHQLALYVPSIENWSVCDCFCGEIRELKNYREELLPLIGMMIATGREFEMRTGVILLMDYYIDDQYIDHALGVFEKIDTSAYYVMMGVAWAVSVAFVKQRDKAAALLERQVLDPKTQNLAISKILESFRVSKQDKELVAKWRLTTNSDPKDV